MARARKKSTGRQRKSKTTTRRKTKTSAARKAGVKRVSLKRISKLKGLTAGWV